MKNPITYARLAVMALVAGIFAAAKWVAEPMYWKMENFQARMGFKLYSVATTVTQGDTYTGKYPVNTQPRDAGIYPITIPVTFPVAAPVANDLHLLCRLLPGVEIVDYTIDLEDHDSSTGSSISIGEANAGLTDLGVVWKSGITQGQAGGLLRYAAATDATRLSTLQATNLANERVVALKWDTAATTYVASKKGLIVLWARG